MIRDSVDRKKSFLDRFEAGYVDLTFRNGISASESRRRRVLSQRISNSSEISNIPTYRIFLREIPSESSLKFRQRGCRRRDSRIDNYNHGATKVARGGGGGRGCERSRDEAVSCGDTHRKTKVIKRATGRCIPIK